MSMQSTALKQDNRETSRLMDEKQSYGRDNGGLIKKLSLKSKNAPVKKNYHLSLTGDDIARFEWLQDRIGSGTQSDVFSAGLNVLEAIVKEHESGSIFFIQRVNNEKERYDLFESS